MKKTVSIVISACDEEENVKELYRQLSAMAKTLPLKSVEYIFTNDGSKDKTLRRLLELQARDPAVKIVNHLRNFGHEIAMTSGMRHASGDAVIFMDADLQHPVKYIPEMIKLWMDGHDIVLTKRKANADYGLLKKFIRKMYYRALNFLSDVKIPEAAPDFRLIDRKYAEMLKNFNERDPMFRGLLSLVSRLDDAAVIEFDAPARIAGKSKYNLVANIRLAMNGIMQFSTRPLYLALIMAILTAFVSLGIGAYVFTEYFFVRNHIPGFSTTILCIIGMGSINLFVLAIIGAYVAKIHIETKKRPLYLAEFITRNNRKKKKTIEAA